MLEEVCKRGAKSVCCCVVKYGMSGIKIGENEDR